MSQIRTDYYQILLAQELSSLRKGDIIAVDRFDVLPVLEALSAGEVITVDISFTPQSVLIRLNRR